MVTAEGRERNSWKNESSRRLPENS